MGSRICPITSYSFPRIGQVEFDPYKLIDHKIGIVQNLDHWALGLYVVYYIQQAHGSWPDSEAGQTHFSCSKQ